VTQPFHLYFLAVVINNPNEPFLMSSLLLRTRAPFFVQRFSFFSILPTPPNLRPMPGPTFVVEPLPLAFLRSRYIIPRPAVHTAAFFVFVDTGRHAGFLQPVRLSSPPRSAVVRVGNTRIPDILGPFHLFLEMCDRQPPPEDRGLTL